MDISLFTTTSLGLSYGITSFDHQLGYPLQLSYLVVLLGLQGEATLTLNFKEYALHPQTLLVLYQDDLVILKSKTPNFKMQVYSIERSLASEIAFDLPHALFGYLHDYPLQELTQAKQHQITLWDAQTRYMLTQATPYLQKMICNHFQNLFLAIAAYMDKNTAFKKRQFSRKEELCWKFWDLIGQYSNQYRAVAFYAEKLHITPFYLSQISKDFLNDSPKDLIHRQVILQLKTILKTTNLSIGEIATQLHFEDPSYMGRFFKRETGVSLTAFRKN